MELVFNNVEDMEPGCLLSSEWFVKSFMQTIIESSVVSIATKPMKTGDIAYYMSKARINIVHVEFYE
jgi:hypothetical protein